MAKICDEQGCESRDCITFEYPDGTHADYCETHAVEHGFCLGCGQLLGGSEAFDFSEVQGFCYDCIRELELVDTYYDNDDYYGVGDEDL